MAHRAIKKKKKLLGKNKISYGPQSNQKFEAFVKYLEKIWNHGSALNSFNWEKKEKDWSSAKTMNGCKFSKEN